MLFVTLGRFKPGANPKESLERRMQWEYPEGLKLVGEYWLQSNDPAFICIAETDSIAALMAATSQWDDLYDMTVVPAVAVEEGLQIAKQMMEQQK